MDKRLPLCYNKRVRKASSEKKNLKKNSKNA